MEASSSADDLAAPESWEVADLEASVSRLMFSKPQSESSPSLSSLTKSTGCSGSDSGSGRVSEDVVNQVDQFLREAIQNPRERVSVLRIEQDVDKFVRDPSRQQLEFDQLPTSYLRLAAHRVAQHYSLQSMVLLDNSLPDGAGSKIIVHKTSNCRLPAIRLADIPVSLPSEDNSLKKFAIKQRPQKQSHAANNSNSKSSKANSSRSVEERKEEYNKARARIFNSSNSISGASGKTVSDPRLMEGSHYGPFGMPNIGGGKPISVVADVNSGSSLTDSATGSSRSARSRTEKEPVGRNKPNNKVAIIRDRDVDRKDPDYDRSYERYVQRFDPGFGFNGGLYGIQPMYTPALNYNTEFPQLGPGHGLQISPECQPRPLPQHIPRMWTAPSVPAAIGYGHPDAIMTPYNNPNQVGPHSASPLYAYTSQYPCQRPGVPFIHHHEHVHQTLAQSYQQQPDASFGLARPR